MPLSLPWIPLSRSFRSFRIAITLRCSDLILSRHPFLYSSYLYRQRILTVASCMGERIRCNSRFTVSPTTLPTGAYGQEATFQCDPNQRNSEDYTIGGIIK